ncbi:unnamed protein product [Euphydryas editha]|uniref:Uncharacterized protein n=1 Tax=Euphydryas editha TaxID=104508 RepID=A0AAU9U4W3_EUPED|nr:unnamed protein product [Euphydryas editha]
MISSVVRKNQNCSKPKSFTPDKALSLMLDASLSKNQYQVIRKATLELGYDIFPSYHKILEAKKECYPSDVEISECGASVNLQKLLDHTTTRIFQTKSEEQLSSIAPELTLCSKWGCDGSSGHSEYKQTFEEGDISDANIFLTSLVPLHLHEKGNMLQVQWKNARTSSTRYCRLVRFQFLKETAEVTRN